MRLFELAYACRVYGHLHWKARYGINPGQVDMWDASVDETSGVVANRIELRDRGSRRRDACGQAGSGKLGAAKAQAFCRSSDSSSPT
jgi:hypothetical protein